MYYIEYQDTKFVRLEAQNYLSAIEQAKFFIKQKQTLKTVVIKDSKENLLCYFKNINSLNKLKNLRKINFIDYVTVGLGVYVLIVEKLGGYRCRLFINDAFNYTATYNELAYRCIKLKLKDNDLIRIFDYYHNQEYFNGYKSKLQRGNYGK